MTMHMLTLAASENEHPTSVLDFYTAPSTPKNPSQPTEHLVVICAKSVKKTVFHAENLSKIFSPYGPIKHIVVGETAKRQAVVSFESAEDARKAKNELANKPCPIFHQRILYIEYGLRKNVTNKDGFCEFLKIANVNTGPEATQEAQRLVPGLLIYPEFISSEREAALLAEVDSTSDDDDWIVMNARRVRHFGYEFDYRTRRCDSNAPLSSMPESFLKLTQEIPTEAMPTPDQITANDYEPGQGIADHIDTHSAFRGGIASLTLGGITVMDFKHPETHDIVSVALPPRSLMVMTGASRYEWTHGIQNRKTDLLNGIQVERKRRVSLTFRKISDDPCKCDFPTHCDTATSASAAGSAPEKLCPTEMEQKYVHEFYEKIASHFSKTRYLPWPRVAEFLKALPPGSLVADIGCGNGKYMACLNEDTVHSSRSVAIGGDRSASLVEISRDRGFQVMQLDAMKVPMRSNAFDVALSIAVLHHLSTTEHRLSALRELVRVLRVGGEALVYVWALEQQSDSKRKFDSHKQDIMVPWNLQQRYIKKESGDELSSSESNTDKKEVVVQRYCHVYHEGELDSLILTLPNVVIEESYYDHSNWCVRFRKTE